MRGVCLLTKCVLCFPQETTHSFSLSPSYLVWSHVWLQCTVLLLLPTQADNYHSVPCKYWALLLKQPQFHYIQPDISLRINLYHNFTPAAPNNIVTLPMSQLALWHFNDFTAAEAERNASTLFFGINVAASWVRKRWCIWRLCNCALVSLRSIYQTLLSLQLVRDVSLVFCLILGISIFVRKWNISRQKCLHESKKKNTKKSKFGGGTVSVNTEISYILSHMSCIVLRDLAGCIEWHCIDLFLSTVLKMKKTQNNLTRYSITW